MRDLVLVPSFFRPEYLFLCLEHLLEAEGGARKEVWVAQDRKTNEPEQWHVILPEISKVLKRFNGAFAGFRFIERKQHSLEGNVYNILELYKEAYSQVDVRYAYLVEDDVLVARDFFRWHEAVQVRSDYFCTVGWQCIRNPAVRPSKDAGHYIETSRDFSSIGVCWRREKLATVVQHACAEYYREGAGYLEREFPASPIPSNQWIEQDGLIMRLILDAKDARVVAWPSLARCAHTGVYGYHRSTGHHFEGTLQQRIENLSEAAKDTKRLLLLSNNSCNDVQALEAVPDWNPEDLTCVQRFVWNGKL